MGRGPHKPRMSRDGSVSEVAMEKALKKAGAKLVTKESKKVMKDVVQDYAEKLAVKVVRNMLDEKIKTVHPRHVIKVIK